MKTLAYIFGIFVTGTYIYISFISRSVRRSRYMYRIIFSLLCVLVGLLLDTLNLFDEPFGFLTIWGAAPMVYLIYYFLLSHIMRPIIGDYPYSPYRDKIGSKPQGLGYPKNRIVKGSDYVFGIILFIIPFLTILFFLGRVD
jgi:hypothetical protein